MQVHAQGIITVALGGTLMAADGTTAIFELALTDDDTVTIRNHFLIQMMVYPNFIKAQLLQENFIKPRNSNLTNKLQ